MSAALRILPCDDVSWCEMFFWDREERIRKLRGVRQIIRNGRMLSVQEIAYRALDTVWSVSWIVGYLRSFFVGIRDKYITFSRIIFIIRIGIVEIIIDVLLFCPRHESFSHIHLSCVVALRRFLGGRIGTSWSCE